VCYDYLLLVQCSLFSCTVLPTEELDQKMWLKHSSEPWSVVLKLWTETASFSQQTIKKSDKSVMQMFWWMAMLQTLCWIHAGNYTPCQHYFHLIIQQHYKTIFIIEFVEYTVFKNQSLFKAVQIFNSRFRICALFYWEHHIIKKNEEWKSALLILFRRRFSLFVFIHWPIMSFELGNFTFSNVRLDSSM